MTAKGTALTHNYEFDSFVWAADNKTAQAKLVCSNCNDEKLDVADVSADAHVAECEKDAYTVYTATYGDKSEEKTVTDEGSALTHNYEFDSFVWAADNKTAQAKLVCSNCNDEKLDVADVSADAHAAECEKDAYTVYTATYGDKSEEKTVTAEGSKLGHAYPLTHVEAKAAGCPNHAVRRLLAAAARVTVTGNDGNIEYWICERCGRYFADAAGTTELTEDEIRIPAAHSLTHVAYKAPTTEAEGNLEYWVCEICGEYFADAAGAQQMADKTTVILPKLEEPSSDEPSSDEPSSEEPSSDEPSSEEPTSGAEPTTENCGGSTVRLSIWQIIINFLKKIFSAFRSVC